MVDRTSRPIVPTEHADEREHRRLLAVRASASLPKDGTEGMTAPLKLQSFNAAELVGDFAASLWEGSVVYVGDEDAIAFSDASAWQRLATASDIAALPPYSTGLWTPTLIMDGVDFTSVTYGAGTGGRYVKIGSLVHIQGTLWTEDINIGSASGSLQIGGLPFHVMADSGTPEDGHSAIALCDVNSWAGTRPGWARTSADSNAIYLFGRTVVANSDGFLDTGDPDTGTDANHIRFGGTYITDE